MNEINSPERSTHDGAAASEWMLPSAALDRFEPPADMALAAVVEKEVARYGFKIGTLGLLIQLGTGSEVMQMPMVWTLPGAPPWFMGLTNLRGNLVPVFDLRQLLGLGQRAVSEKPLVLVLDQGDKAVGMVINDFPRPIIGMSLLPHLPQLPTVLKAHVRLGYVKDDMIWLEFDHNSFFEELVHAGES